jgi:integrase
LLTLIKLVYFNGIEFKIYDNDLGTSIQFSPGTNLDYDYEAVWIKSSKRARARKIAVNNLGWSILTFLAERVGEGYLFRHQRTGERLKDFKKAWWNTLAKAKIDKFQFRDLRHCFATSMLAGGADMRLIQTAMSHQRIKTSEIYAQVQDSHLRQSLEKVSDDVMKRSFPH